MFVPRIGHLDKTRFGINFKVDDIKCELFKKEDKNLKTDVYNKKESK